MMSKNARLQRQVASWLRYEAAGDEERAAEALRGALSRLSAELPPPGFADRVLAASGLGSRRRPTIPAWVWQGAFLAWLVSSSLVALKVVGFARDLAASGQVVGLWARFIVAASRMVAEAITLVRGLLRAGEAVSAALSGPSFLLLVLACALASLTALGALKPLLIPERSRHVESH
jgi:hypothetical protein